MEKKSEFQRDIERVINRHSKENDSNTPDFILAQFLVRTLEAFNEAVMQREGWYGRQPEEFIALNKQETEGGENERDTEMEAKKSKRFFAR